MAQKNNPWERQSWDTESSYYAFVTYYLVQEHPRSLNAAYRQHWVDMRLDELFPSREAVSPEEIAEAKTALEAEAENRTASGQWQQWYRAINRDGRLREPHAINWEKRALAHDDHESELVIKQLERKRVKSRVETAELGEMLRAKALNALKHLTAIDQEVITRNGETVIVLKVALTPHEIAHMAEVGVELERLALGLPAKTLDLTSGEKELEPISFIHVHPPVKPDDYEDEDEDEAVDDA